MDRVRKFLLKFYRGVQTPLSERCRVLVESREWDQLQKLVAGEPSSFKTPRDYFDEVMVIDLTRKLLLPGDTDRRRAAAVSNFWASETQCCSTNARLTRFIQNQGPFGPSDERVIHFINVWRKEVKKVLGRCPELLEPSFSGGSTLSDKGKLTTIPDKMSSVPTAYTGFNHVPYDSCRFTPLGEKQWEIVRSNRFFTVPKDSQKDRGCCVEASIAASMQLAVGKLLKRRYREVYGVDLTKAQSLHRRLARDASAGMRDLATIDLSNASDTVSRKLIELILPEDWFSLLNSLRAKSTEIDGRVVYLEKFSSMGNGFTFELETIVFKTLCVTVGCSESYVYGDDIIIPTECTPDFLAALSFFGFTPNWKKTFCEGPFRESCGGDFFNGVAVRPHYLKEIPDEPQKWISLANGIRRLDENLDRLHACWRFCIDQIPEHIRVYGPSMLGDLVIYCPDAKPTYRQYKTYDGRTRRYVSNSPTYFWRIYRPIQRSYKLGVYWDLRISAAAATKGCPSEVVPRDSIAGYKLDWCAAYGLQDHSWWCGS